MRTGGGDGGGVGGTSGGQGVTSGVPLWAFGVSALITAAFVTVDVFTRLHDTPALRAPGARVELVAWEVTSGAMVILLLPLVARAIALGQPGRIGWARSLAVHAAGALLFFALHVGGFILLRKLFYAVQGSRYVFGGAAEWLYELRKDLLTYALLTSSLIGARGMGRPGAAPTATTPTREAPAAARPEPTFDIRDGSRLVRTPVREMLAVVSAGNYVEVKLADGRSPLMRATLAAMEIELAPHGFLRTHRSWLVNPQRVRMIAPSGSGDHRLELEGGLEAPLSRRYAEALEALRRAT